jgi:hypothetical protein
MSPVTNLAEYAADHSPRGASITRHPSQYDDRDEDAADLD